VNRASPTYDKSLSTQYRKKLVLNPRKVFFARKMQGFAIAICEKIFVLHHLLPLIYLFMLGRRELPNVFNWFKQVSQEVILVNTYLLKFNFNIKTTNIINIYKYIFFTPTVSSQLTFELMKVFNIMCIHVF